jgi:hypothetical protein
VRRDGTTSSSSPGKRQIFLDPPNPFLGPADKGLTITLGEDITADAVRIVKEKCPTGTNIDPCSGELGTLLQNAHLGKRFEMTLGENRAFAFLASIINVIILDVRGGRVSSKQATFKLEEDTVRQIKSMPDGTDFAMAIPQGDFDFQTMTTSVKIGPTPAPDLK